MVRKDVKKVRGQQQQPKEEPQEEQQQQQQHNSEVPKQQKSGCLGYSLLTWAVMVTCVLLLLIGSLPVVRIPVTTTSTTTDTKCCEVPTTTTTSTSSTPREQPDPKDLFRAHYQRFFPDDASLADLEAHKAEFLSSDYAQGAYGYDGKLEGIVGKELGRFTNDIYFDYTGAGVYQRSQVERALGDIVSEQYGNAHSRNPSSLNTESHVSRMRYDILRHFNVTADEYTVIFTSGATGALKLIAESFPWTNASKFVYLRQNHNSVLGIREVAMDQGAQFLAIPESEMSDDKCNHFFGGAPCAAGTTRRTVLLTDFPDTTYNLFAFPAEDNYAGVKYPLDWIRMFHEKSRGEEGTGKWLVLLDAAAFVPTNTLDLHTYPADFVSISFYKMFGYPTGIGALLVRNEVTEIMQKTFFGGGTVVLSSCDTHFCRLHNCPSSRFEDGTISFLSIAELRYGFDALRSVLPKPAQGSPAPPYGDISPITNHVWSLTHYLYEEMSAMKHSNGAPVFRIYGKHAEGSKYQGGIINFNVLYPDGSYMGYHDVQYLTANEHIHVRTGCNCNPGACYDYLGVTNDEVFKYSENKDSCSDEMDLTEEGKPLGSVRLSLGYLSTFEDVYAFLKVAKKNFVH